MPRGQSVAAPATRLAHAGYLVRSVKIPRYMEVVPDGRRAGGPPGRATLSERTPKLSLGFMRIWPRAGARVDASCPEELALAARVRDGDRAAITAVYRAQHAALRRFARRITGDDAAAEDLVQDVFVQLPRLARRYRGEARFATFLVGVAVSLSRRHVRAAMRRRAATAKLALLHVPSAGPSAPGHDLELVYRALDALPHAQRTAFVLCEVEERTALEVAELLGVPEGTVRTRCFHARAKLRARLERAGLREPSGEGR